MYGYDFGLSKSNESYQSLIALRNQGLINERPPGYDDYSPGRPATEMLEKSAYNLATFYRNQLNATALTEQVPHQVWVTTNSEEGTHLELRDLHELCDTEGGRQACCVGSFLFTETGSGTRIKFCTP
ncbi:MAG: hypothetical protein ACLFP8_07380 [Alphaproteobacteria bacterium]